VRERSSQSRSFPTDSSFCSSASVKAAPAIAAVYLEVALAGEDGAQRSGNGGAEARERGFVLRGLAILQPSTVRRSPSGRVREKATRISVGPSGT
jgi:hypothetical protein